MRPGVLIPPARNLSEFHARVGRGLRRVAEEMHRAPPYRKRRDALSQTTHFFRAKRERARRATSPEQSGKVWPAGRFARAKRQSPRARRLLQSKAGKRGPADFFRAKRESRPRPSDFSRAKRKSRPRRWDFSRAKRRSAARRLSQSKAEKRRPVAFPEQSGKVWPAGASPEQSGKARARRLSQSKARKPATGLSQSKAEKRRPRARPETFAEQSAKPGGGRFRAGKCESGSGPPPGPPSRASYIARKAKTAPPGLSQTTQKVRGLLSGLFGPAE